MRKNIWIMNHYAGSMFFDKGGRHYNFAKYLRRAGYEPVIFCANSKHGQQELFFDNKNLWHEHIAEEIDTPFVFVKVRTYQGNGKQRVLNMVDFYRNVKKTAREYAKKHGKPDIIYASSVHPLTLIAGIQLAKYFGVKCVCEVRDLWPESIVAYSTRLTKSNPVIKLLYLGEKWIYTHADSLIFTMENAYDYIVEQGWNKNIPREKVHYINNGVDLEAFRNNQKQYILDDPDLQNQDTFKVIYTGSLRKANSSVIRLVEAAELLQNYSEIQILVYGGGEILPSLQTYCDEKKLTNVILKGRVDKKYIPYVLGRSSVNILNCEDSPIYRFGTSQNKLFEYIASGNPIISGQYTGPSIIEEYGIGISRKMDSVQEVAKAILEVKSSNYPPEAFKLAVQNYSFYTLTQKLITVVEKNYG